MSFLSLFSPILLFLGLFVGSGIYFSIQGVENAFYLITPVSAIIPAIILAFYLHKKKFEESMQCFLDGFGHRDIITMCLMFLLAGAFNHVTKAIGCVDATVNLILNFLPAKLILIGVFLTSAFVSTAIGTSMGTIATIGPIAASLGEHGAIPMELGLATVIGGAMFGDSLSPVSDTTIAAVMSQKANYQKKLLLNTKVAIAAALLTLIVLFSTNSSYSSVHFEQFDLLKIVPYVTIVILAFSGVNVFVVLLTGIGLSALIGMALYDYNFIKLSKNVASGFDSVNEIFLLSLLVAGLGGLLKDQGSFKKITSSITGIKSLTQKSAQLIIAFLVSIFDILIPINTVAIILTGDIAKDIAKQYQIPTYVTAAWLDVFSCVFQGILPYGAQILLASSLGNVSPFALSTKVYFCYMIFITSIIYITFAKIPKEKVLGAQN